MVTNRRVTTRTHIITEQVKCTRARACVCVCVGHGLELPRTQTTGVIQLSVDQVTKLCDYEQLKP